MQIVLQILLIATALFMIMLVLVQRGRGGGLAGALGGMGGQSAFGTKAGDMFTRITIVTAAIWILLCMYSVVYLNKQPTINSPYVHRNAKWSEGYASLESEIENVVRQQIRRGTVSVNLRVDRAASPDDYKLNTAVLASYREQLEHLHAEWHVVQPVSLE